MIEGKITDKLKKPIRAECKKTLAGGNIRARETTSPKWTLSKLLNCYSTKSQKLLQSHSFLYLIKSCPLYKTIKGFHMQNATNKAFCASTSILFRVFFSFFDPQIYIKDNWKTIYPYPKNKKSIITSYFTYYQHIRMCYIHVFYIHIFQGNIYLHFNGFIAPTAK